jgi:hypothetical protein
MLNRGRPIVDTKIWFDMGGPRGRNLSRKAEIFNKDRLAKLHQNEDKVIIPREWALSAEPTRHEARRRVRLHRRERLRSKLL